MQRTKGSSKDRHWPFLRRRRLGPWRETVVLPNGRELLLRPIEPADAEPLRAGFDLLTPEEVRMRFLSPLKELSPELAHRLTNLDPQRAFALVAAEPLPVGDALVGAVARASIDENSNEAEFALLVGRHISGWGLGSHMLLRVVDWCRRRRVDAVYGDVLMENTLMLRLTDRLGFERSHVMGDQGLVRIRLQLRTPASIK